ncbi:FeoB-associated Cys-rich membrane protein [Desulfocurvus sp. DL9XJH121]
MSEVMDWGLVGAIVLVAAVYVLRRFMRSKDSGCGCGCGGDCASGCGSGVPGPSCTRELKPMEPEDK